MIAWRMQSCTQQMLIPYTRLFQYHIACDLKGVLES
jgi:hypothetical protein